ncbi:MAG TPA: hypothetical protein VFR23_03720 [Jiangellaceae bacterium]|nr:hypothetical protein [Jiangellaceae bacterium]
MVARLIRCTLLGVGAMRSPLYRPSGLLVAYGRRRLYLDGGPGAEPPAETKAWLLTDDQAELSGPIRRMAAGAGIERPAVRRLDVDGLWVQPKPVEHTNHPAYGYLLEAGERRVVWAPEFWTFPNWADDADLMFADAAGWNRPIRFRGGIGGHACVLDISATARKRGVRRLVFAHIGRPSIRARDAGERPPFGEWGVEGRTYVVRS